MRTARSAATVVLAASTLMLAVPRGAAPQATIVERNDTVRNVIVIDGKLVVHQQLPGEESGIRLAPDAISPETHAKEQAIENRLAGQVRPNRPSALVKGEMDNIVQIEGAFAIKRSKDDKACIEIGTVGGDDDCKKK